MATVEPICYRNRHFSAAKNYRHGAHRACSPEETLERIKPHFEVVGLTRLANITGLDCIGIPVTLAIRPNSASITTSSGKGASLSAAKVSGAMEAIELFHAEQARVEEFAMPYNAFAPDEVVRLEHLPLRKHSLFTPERVERWSNGWDIVAGREIAIPAALLSMDYRRLRQLMPLQPFCVDSNGLASGNHLLEALSSGLLEVIERDAVGCHQLAQRTHGHQPNRINLGSINASMLQELFSRCRAAQIEPVLYDYSVDTGVPVIVARIYDLSGTFGPFDGYGAHLDPEVAMVRALTEAVQSRAVLISGARDDLFPHQYTYIRNLAEQRMQPSLHEPSIDACMLPSLATDTFEGDIRVLLGCLQQAGLHQVIVADLTLPQFDIAVVKVFVPGLEAHLAQGYTYRGRAHDYSHSLPASARDGEGRTETIAHLPAGGAL